MNDIITEINQELREDRGRALWKKYGHYVIAFVLAVVMLVAGRQGLIAYQENAQTSAANAYLEAVKADGNDALIALAGDGGEGYPMLAEFTAAARAAKAGDLAAAEAGYLKIAANNNIALLYQQAATLLSVMNGASSVDERIQRATPIANADGPWQKLALEVLIGLAIEKGDIAGARKQLETLRFTPNISADLNQRLILIDAALGE